MERKEEKWRNKQREGRDLCKQRYGGERMEEVKEKEMTSTDIVYRTEVMT